MCGVYGVCDWSVCVCAHVDRCGRAFVICVSVCGYVDGVGMCVCEG